MRIWLLIINDVLTWLDLDEKEQIQCKALKFIKKGDIILIYKRNPHNRITHIFKCTRGSYIDYTSDDWDGYVIDIGKGIELTNPIKFRQMQNILKISHWKKKKKELCIKIPIGNWRILKTHIIDKNSQIKSKIEEFETCLIKSQDYVDSLNQRGLNFYLNQDYENALECCNKVLNINPNNITALMNKGKIHGAMNEYHKALLCFDDILAIHKNIDALIGKGRVLGTLTKYNEALKYFDCVLNKDPNNTEALHFKGITLANLSRYKESAQCFDLVLIHDPSNHDVQECRRFVSKHI